MQTQSGLSLLFFFIFFFACTLGMAQEKPKMLQWDFPLPRTHTGVLIGNGVQGLMVWGEGNQLNITIGRAGFWDRRGGNDFSSSTTYTEVRELLEANDEPGILAAFAGPKKPEGTPERPFQIGGGRLEVSMPEGWALETGDLDLNNAQLNISVSDPAGNEHTIAIQQAVKQEFAWLELPQALQGKVSLRLRPSWEWVQDELSSMGVSKPEEWATNEEISSGGFIQRLPADEPLSISYAVYDNKVNIASALGKEAQKEALQLAASQQWSAIEQDNKQWWAEYWEDIPKVNLPDPKLQELYDYGVYKQACVTPPQGLAATLQGPFNEEYRLPPWSNDYHFNINIEMIYWPALATNRSEHLKPMWDLLFSWMPQMQKNGEKFFGEEGALMLPHAVDDQCQVVGLFWAGTIDQACAAWMAQLAWLQYRYTMDEQVLRDIAWPLLSGAFNGYWGMIEEEADGSFSLPVSVSPEFRGSDMNAWGKNASFQLAALHMLADVLPKAASILGKENDSRWQQVSEKLPPYAVVKGPTWLESGQNVQPRIALWEGMDLITSHRHHSHLASIYPFATVDPFSEEHQEIVMHSLNFWTLRGPGAWSGWCVPWAATLNARFDRTEAAVHWLHTFKDVYTNAGRGTLHNAAFPGFSMIYQPVWEKTDGQNGEVMQLDGGFGAITAITELLVQNRNDGIHVLPSLHRDWKELSFENIRAEGAFQISAKVEGGLVSEVKVKSLAGGPLSLVHKLGEKWSMNGKEQKGARLEKKCSAGEEIILKRL
ncbi:MAG: glycosyl hydrolase family 95 catalytic domain-containing protein [Cyclobacteriaceae bacterium]